VLDFQLLGGCALKTPDFSPDLRFFQEIMRLRSCGLGTVSSADRGLRSVPVKNVFPAETALRG